MGRRPKPKEVHDRRGNPSRKNLDDIDQPMPEPGVGDPPDWVQGYARIIWNDHREWLEQSNYLAITDTIAFSAYCIYAAKWRDACCRDDADDTVKWWKLLDPLMSKLGLTPTDRAKVSAARGKPIDNPFTVVPGKKPGRPGKGGA